MKIASIQFLRAIAVLLIVFAYSIDLTMLTTKLDDFYYLSEIGFIGHDLFIVISGFIVTYTAVQYNGLNDGVFFLQKRFFRINPIYYLGSLLYIGCHILHGAYGSNMLPMPLSMMLTSFADTLLVVPTSTDLKGFRPLLMGGWILAFGWLFYILFSIIIIAKVKHKIRVLGLILVLLAGIGFLLRPVDLRLMFLTNPILLEFLLGILIAHLYLRFPKIPFIISIGLLLVGISWVVLLIFRGYGFISVPAAILNGSLSLNRVLLWGLPACSIVAGCLFLEREGWFKRVWNNRFSQALGNASFSIYLTHAAVFSLLALLYQRAQLSLLPNVGIILQVIVTGIIGYCFYRWVEKPLLKWFDKFYHRPTNIQVSSPHTQPST